MGVIDFIEFQQVLNTLRYLCKSRLQARRILCIQRHFVLFFYGRSKLSEEECARVEFCNTIRIYIRVYESSLMNFKQVTNCKCAAA